MHARMLHFSFSLLIQALILLFSGPVSSTAVSIELRIRDKSSSFPCQFIFNSPQQFQISSCYNCNSCWNWRHLIFFFRVGPYLSLLEKWFHGDSIRTRQREREREREREIGFCRVPAWVKNFRTNVENQVKSRYDKLVVANLGCVIFVHGQFFH